MRGKRRGKLCEAVCGCSEISVRGGREVFAYGVRAICEYSETRVSLRLSDMTLSVSGSALTMKSYYNSSVSVFGDVRGIEFER